MKKEEIELTDSQLKIISHSLGIDIIRAKESDNEKYKFLPEEFYRNYYCVGKSLNMTDDMKILEELGFIEKWINGEQLYFEITKEGVDYFKDWFEKEITVKRQRTTKSKQRYNEYIDADYFDNFKDYLQIESPKIERSNQGVRVVSTKYDDVKGEFKKTIKEAKLSYKEKLKIKLEILRKCKILSTQ